MQRVGLPSILLAIVLTAAGCADTTYVYRPAENATASLGGLTGAKYPIPAGHPAGEVVVASTGVTELTLADVATRVLLVRMIVTNQTDDATWSVDTRQQTATIEGQLQAPIYASVQNQPAPSVVQIARGERRNIDLYYRLPGSSDTNENVPRFDLAWSVRTGSQTFAESTSFNRLAVEPMYVSDGYYGPGYYRYGPGFGPYYYGGAYGYWGSPYYYPSYGVHFGGGAGRWGGRRSYRPAR